MSLVTYAVGASSEQDRVLSEDVLGCTRDGVEGTRQTESSTIHEPSTTFF